MSNPRNVDPQYFISVLEPVAQPISMFQRHAPIAIAVLMAPIAFAALTALWLIRFACNGNERRDERGGVRSKANAMDTPTRHSGSLAG